MKKVWIVKKLCYTASGTLEYDQVAAFATKAKAELHRDICNYRYREFNHEVEEIEFDD